MADKPNLGYEEFAASGSFINAVGYNHDTPALHIKFKSGGEGIYRGCPVEHFNAMASAESVGKYWHANIKGKNWEEPPTE